ncbi:50S ribosomal protein L23 [Magnetofaba australis]|uniref:Large ribosomal subunit protein uL23 n=1 Tax=Magnetofaba australis IT-1 TaxID=1434232 RepID=A0A1Y2K353_9PROT|nr:50S ribosomal protein L23 [Magnetofaba australis]OSM02451.1 putative 50S ribosomal protein L23 [Magnetofaba australis IT-1]
MSDANILYKVLEAPIVTEKSTLCLEKSNQVVFRVAPWANKLQIKSAVEKLFKVDVVSVKTVSVKGKIKRFGRLTGKRKDTKKAMVRLKDGQSIDFFNAGA